MRSSSILQQETPDIDHDPPLDEEGRALVTIGISAYHKAVPIIDFRFLVNPAHLNP